MENWTKRILLMVFVLAGTFASLPGGALRAEVSDAQSADERPLIEPDIVPRPVLEPAIDTEDLEIGFMTGLISIEDFEVPWFLGLRAAYHLTEYLFLEGNFGYADAGQTSFERLGGGVELLTDDERTYAYYNLSVGYNLLPGEAFVGRDYAFNTNLYLVGGMGATHFAGDNALTINYGLGYQFLFNDWLSLHVQMRNYLYDIELLGEEKTSANLQFATGLSMFF